MTRADRFIGIGLAALYFVLLCSTLDIGFPRDEGFYFTAAEQYAKWYDDLLDDPKTAFRKETVDKHFGYNGEHPALPKMLFGLSWRLFGDIKSVDEVPNIRHWYDGGRNPEPILPIMRESTAMRLPALLVASWLVYLIMAFGTRYFGRRVGIAAAVAYMFMPHAFWHAHLSCFDTPVAVMWFLTAYCFIRAETGGWRWALLTGVAWGLALSTKHNAFFIPPTLLIWWLIAHRREFGLSRADGGVGIRLPAIPLAFVAMLVVAPVVYYLLWPRLWHEPIRHLKWYFGFHANHVMYWAYYWGWLYTKPPYPIGFSFVMSAMTIPGPTVLLGIVGMLRVAYEWAVRTGARFAGSLRRIAESLPARQPGVVLFVFLNFFIPFAVIANTKVPIFGGTKHWLPGVPFLAILAGLAFELVLASVRELGAWVPRLGGRGA
ncbi:MAG: glycosyltransferase family 39 protein, partial [Deltaproteobacteria bacterium]|nr:glycosyltransferase family 39 protein [Deltaproteobacteria bacterium]